MAIATDKYYTGDDKTAPKTSYSYEYENEKDLITTEVTEIIRLQRQKWVKSGTVKKYILEMVQMMF